jgi:NADPH2:quinone reductase
MQGSFTLIRPSLPHYIADRVSLLARAHAVFQLVLDGKLSLHVGQTYSLAEVGKAHHAIEQRLTMGKTLLLTETLSA